MAKEHYSFDELKEMLNERGLEHFLLPGTNNMLRLGDEDTTIYCAKDGFILYATRKDYDAITQYYWPDDRCTLHSTKDAGKEGCEQIISFERTKGDNQVICLEDGNAEMNADAPKCQPDRIYLYTNENMDYILNILQEQRQSSTMGKRFDTNDSVWIATAAMTYELYHKKKNAGETIHIPDFHFVQSDIRNRTLEINGHKAEGARTSQWCCGDHPNHNYCFLRELTDKTRRLSFPGEFGGKEEPENLKMDEVIKTSVGNVTIQQLFDFVHTEYAALSDQVIKKTSIDYKAPLDYLDAHAKESYAGPDKQVPADERARMDALKESAQNAVEQINKMMALCEKRFKLKKAAQVKWLDGSLVKTKHYLWGQMKYSDFMDSPITISIFVDKNADTMEPRYRISLEIMNKDSDKALMKQYHSYLDLEPDTENGLVYGGDSNEEGYVVILDEDRDSIKANIENKTYDKVQYCKIIEQNESYSNEDYERLVMKGVQALIPYYEHVIGKKAGKTRGWLLTWNPENWEWQHFPVWCQQTRKGETRKEDWTCANKSPEIGDDVFLMKTGEQPRGIIAHGIVGREYYEAPHYDPAKAAQGKMTGHIDAIFDRILDYTKEAILLQDELKQTLPEQTWSPMGSEIEIKPEVLTELRDRWNELVASDEEQKTMSKNDTFGLNTILYGPPGTGKTYNTVKYAVSICDPDLNVDEMEYSDILARYNTLKAEGRIAFTTFHQSYGYEEFIEGIKPVLASDENQSNSKDIQYKVKAGIFKQFCKDAAPKWVSLDNSLVDLEGNIWKATIKSNVLQDCYDNNRVRIDWGMDSEGAYGFVNSMEAGDIIITTDGSRTKINGIAKVVSDEAYELDAESDRTTRDVVWLAKNLDEDITGINDGKILHRMTVARVPHMQVGYLIPIIKRANPGLVEIEEKERLPHVFIIDEINRGNISKIFGELITLIEDTKRDGMDEAMETTLPYSGDPFSVPDNVYILGTMNTADRSIALMDTALRRRFDFVEMMPDSSVIDGVTVEVGDQKVNVAHMLDVINERIEFLYDREHTIGHAFFTPLLKNNSIDVLADIFRSKVVPLLQEYFYEDYAKIQLVLGDNDKSDDGYKFILDKEVKVKSVFKGNPEEIVDLPEKKYEIQDEAFDDIQSYIEIFN